MFSIPVDINCIILRSSHSTPSPSSLPLPSPVDSVAADWHELSNYFHHMPTLKYTDKGVRCIGSRLIPYFKLFLENYGVLVNAVIDRACVKSIISSKICNSLYMDSSALKPRKILRTSNTETKQHTRIFWLPHTKQDIIGVHLFNFLLSTDSTNITKCAMSITLHMNRTPCHTTWRQHPCVS